MKKQLTLTPKQEIFTKAYLSTGNATEAASRAYKPKNRATARSIGSENLTKPHIRAYLDERAKEAAAIVYELSQKAKSEAVRLNACKDILDRAGYFSERSLVGGSMLSANLEIIVISPEKKKMAAGAIGSYLAERERTTI